MNKRNLILDKYPESEFLFAEGYDEAIIGVVEGYDDQMKICYDKSKIIRILVKNGMDYIDATEFYYFNIVGSYMGEKTPIFIETI